MVCYTYEIRLNGHSGFFWSFTITEKKKKWLNSEEIHHWTSREANRHENIMNSRSYIIDCIHFSKNSTIVIFFPHLI